MPLGSLCRVTAGFVRLGDGRAPMTPPGALSLLLPPLFESDPEQLYPGRGMGRGGLGEWNDQG